ncbi:hypothetical protein RUND412_005875 [Rhizina undulata]
MSANMKGRAADGGNSGEMMLVTQLSDSELYKIPKPHFNTTPPKKRKTSEPVTEAAPGTPNHQKRCATTENQSSQEWARQHTTNLLVHNYAELNWKQLAKSLD